MLPNEYLTQLQGALAELSSPAAEPSVLYPGPERYKLICFLLERLLTPELLDSLLGRIPVADIPSGLSAEEEEAHRIARVLKAVGFRATAEEVRGSGSKEDSLRLLAALASYTAKHLRFKRDAAAAASTSTLAGGGATGSGPLNPAANAPTSTPRQRTPSKACAHGSGGGGRLGLHTLEAEQRMLESLAEKVPQLLDPSGGGNWFPGDIMSALQPYMSQLPVAELAAHVQQRAQALQLDHVALQEEQALLASKVTFASDAEWQRQAEATRRGLAELLRTSEAFYQTFQTGLGVWCGASKAAETCGLGRAASELLARFAAVQQLATGLARVRHAYGNIVNSSPPLAILDRHALSQLVRAGQGAVEHARARNAAEQHARADAQRVHAVMAQCATDTASPSM